MAFRLDEQVAAAFKSLFGIAHTGMSNREWYAELFGRKPPQYGSETWRELTYGTDYYSFHDGAVTLDAAVTQTRTWTGSAWSTVAGSGVLPVEKIISPLTLCNATNNQAHISLATPVTTVDPPNVTPASRLMDYIRFTDFGSDFMPRIFWDNGSGTAPGTEIVTVGLANDWIWDEGTGLLLCGADLADQFTPTGHLPIWIQHYRYIGTKGLTPGAAGITGYVDVACLTSDTIGSPVSIREAPINGKWRVHTADPTNFVKMPAVGILISKSTPTVGVARVLGTCDAFSGLTPGVNYMVGAGGTLVAAIPGTSATGSYWGQHLGIAVSADTLMLNGNVNMIEYRV